MIAALAKGDIAEHALHRAFEDAKRDAEASSQFVRGCGRFPLTAFGDVNTYALFAGSFFLRLANPQGRAGLIVPTGIATDDSTLMFAISSSRHRKSLLVCSSGSAWPPLGKAGGTIMKRRLIML